MVSQSDMHKFCGCSEGVFNRFIVEKGILKASLHHQTEGLVSLYEASHLAQEGEHVLEEAINFTTKQLKSLMEGSLEPHLRKHVAHALELPLNWKMPRLQTRWFIEASQREAKMNPVLLELAKLDFNRVQSIHQRELREVSRYFELALLESCHVHSALVHESANFSTNFWLSIRWWSNLGLAQRLPFSRDREVQTKANCLITTIDDVYDVYGTMDELELFTDAVDRWDVNATGKLPEYMKICFIALFNTTNDTAYNCNPWVQWADVCKADMVEASDDVSQETLEDFHSCPEIARRSSMILRLCDDLGTSKDELERGDVSKSIQCLHA
ncbi:monoterpene synthase 7, chloroplastic-like [Musa acuminata AAA Group]|uniref:monoterpene synthase 7, chloroplastic-like n=1 Tax=Musa acuminata AAA Group TaxID=214697 RepID=UPI0031DEBDA5